ncbi:MAG: regulatory protein RecX [Sphingomonadaceae bacterium]
MAALIEQLAALGYVDDRAFALARARSLGRRGYGEHRVAGALREAGIEEEDAEAVIGEARDEALATALRFAARRGIGPFAEERTDRKGREKALAAMVRAGHPFGIARLIVDSPPGEIPGSDII